VGVHNQICTGLDQAIVIDECTGLQVKINIGNNATVAIIQRLRLTVDAGTIGGYATGGAIQAIAAGRLVL
jgi:hypothetical protein